MRFFITGGSGFIGSHLAERLLDDGHSVTVLDNFSTGRLSNLDAVQGRAGFDLIEDDVVTPSHDLKKLFSNVDTVIHLAATVGVELVVNEPLRTIRTNVIGTENVLRAVSGNAKRRLILASTSEVYGKSSKDLFHESDDLLIGQPVHSRWSYSCSKLLDEFCVTSAHREGLLDGVVLRLFNTVGPRQLGQYGMVLPRFAEKALRGEPVTVYGSGRQSRCFCHVLDTVEAFRRIAYREDAGGRVFNVGSSRSVTIMELAEMVKERAHSSSEITLIPYEKAYNAGFEDMLRRAPDTSAIREFVSWEPERTLENIIDDVIADRKKYL